MSQPANPLHPAVAAGDYAAVEALLMFGASANAVLVERTGQICEKTPPIFRAVLNGDTKMVRLLLARGADVSSAYRLTHGSECIRIPSLFAACLLKNAEIATLLLQKGANANGQYEHSYPFGEYRIPCLIGAMSGEGVLAGPRELQQIPTCDDRVTINVVRRLVEFGADVGVSSVRRQVIDDEQYITETVEVSVRDIAQRDPRLVRLLAP